MTSTQWIIVSSKEREKRDRSASMVIVLKFHTPMFLKHGIYSVDPEQSDQGLHWLPFH